MSARTARHNTRWDAPHAGACHTPIISILSSEQSIKSARKSLGGIRPFTPDTNTMPAGCDRRITTPASRQAQGLGCQIDITGSGQGRWGARRFPTRFATGGTLAGAMACMD
jgi:hypothetical protein